jgi:hypothetical protein
MSRPSQTVTNFDGDIAMREKDLEKTLTLEAK